MAVNAYKVCIYNATDQAHMLFVPIDGPQTGAKMVAPLS